MRGVRGPAAKRRKVGRIVSVGESLRGRAELPDRYRIMLMVISLGLK